VARRARNKRLRDARQRDVVRVIPLKPITPLGILLMIVSGILGGLSIAPALLWAMASDNASRVPHGDAWAEFWKLAFPNPYIGTFLSIFTLMSALATAAGTFMILRQWGSRAGLMDVGLRGAFGLAAAGVSSSMGGGASGGGRFGGGGATGSW
jgi:uncharacterized membrane protein YgcG